MDINETQKKIIVSLFRSGPLSHKGLAQELNISNPAVTLSLKPLLASGAVRNVENSDARKAVGRQEEKVDLNAEFAYLLGIDVRKRFIYISKTDFRGKLLDSVRFDSFEKVSSYIKALLDKKEKILGCAATLRGFTTMQELAMSNPSLYQSLLSLPIAVHPVNNVECLAYIHRLYHKEDSNFLLVKYGPGLGSSLFIDGHPLKDSRGSNSELGHTFLAPSRRLEDEISFETLLGSETDYDEKEGAALLKADEKKLSKVLSVLSLMFINASYMLSLDKIVCSGILLSDSEIKERLEEEISRIDPKFDLSKLMIYEGYEDIYSIKGSLQVFIDRYLD